MNFYGIDMNVVSVARSMVIFQMFKSNADPDSIFELWYQSCISKKTLKYFLEAIKQILKDSEN